MSGGDVVPYLDSRNTKGHGNHNSNSQSKILAKLLGSVAGKAMVVLCGKCGAMRECMWHWAKIWRGLGGKRMVDGGFCCQGPDVRGRWPDVRAAGCPGLSGRMSGRWVRGRI